MSITLKSSNYIKPIQLLIIIHQNPYYIASFIHSTTHKPSFNQHKHEVPSKQNSSLSNIDQIVEILKSNNNETWNTNEHLSNLIVTSSKPLSSYEILTIARHLGDSSLAFSFVQYLRSNSNFQSSSNNNDDSISFAFQAVFELASRRPGWIEKLLELYNTSKELGIPLSFNSAILLIRCFARGGMIDNALKVFGEISCGTRNTHIRNVLIEELFRCGCFDDALQVLDEMLQPNGEFMPDLNTLMIVFPGFFDAKNHGGKVSEEGGLELVFKFGRRGVFPDSIMLTQWISMLCRRKKNGIAWKLLHGIMELEGPIEVASCNAMLTGLAKEGEFKKMKVLMEEMRVKGISPSVVTLGISINHLCKTNRIDEALVLFEKMKVGEIGVVEPDVIICNTLINGLCKVGRVEEGLAMMRKMVSEGKCTPTSVTYNCLIDGFCKEGELDRALEFFDEMEKEGIRPNIITVNTLVGGMCRVERIGSAMKFYRKMEGKGLKGNKVTYTTLIGAFCSVNNIKKARELFDEVKQVCAPDAVIYYTLIAGLSQAGLVDEVEEVLTEMKSAGFRPDIDCYNVMINAFCKKNKLDKVHCLLEEMGKIGLKPNSITYNSLIWYFSKTRDLNSAHRLLRQMLDDNVVPTVHTYGALIYACCKVGELDDAMKIFKQMSSSSKVPPDTVIYNILIDCFRQKQKTKVALTLFEDMITKGINPNSNTFNALFKGLRDENCLEKALELMGKMNDLACQPDYITMEILTEWLTAIGKADKLRQFVEVFR